MHLDGKLLVGRQCVHDQSSMCNLYLL